MSWQSVSIQILRTLINDLSDSPTYQDDILEMLLRTSASYVKQEIQLTTTYTISLSCGDITPDPSSDETFLNFIVLKAACIINNWKFDEKVAIEGIKAKCGPAELQVNAGQATLLAFLKEGYCKIYDRLRMEHNMGVSTNIKGIFGPFRSNLYNPSTSFLSR